MVRAGFAFLIVVAWSTGVATSAYNFQDAWAPPEAEPPAPAAAPEPEPDPRPSSLDESIEPTPV